MQSSYLYKDSAMLWNSLCILFKIGKHFNLAYQIISADFQCS